ncbi:hypothetical protein J3458_013099 [Metarhizium acridum]|uniref:uncharacterized protein n=1 Tax=Metarhizium acridum TaxID=92637 RepID=UPI001C6D2378|nr:hypothetical protein J3458_013099 [Metarhizium acridum]
MDSGTATGISRRRLVYKVVDGHEIDVDVYLFPPAPNAPNYGYCSIINIHGGAFMLGSSAMVNKDQVKDCLDRRWIVLVPNHRLCPQVNLLEGPIQDCRDLLSWMHNGGFEKALPPEVAAQYPP